MVKAGVERRERVRGEEGLRGEEGKGEGRGEGRDEERRRKMASSLPLGDKGLRVRCKSRTKQTF